MRLMSKPAPSLPMRSVVLRVAALALLLLLVLVAILTVRTLNRLPDSVIYLVDAARDRFTLEQVGRQSEAEGLEAKLRHSVQALIEGPTDAEAARGLSSSFPADTRVLGLQVKGETVIVDLSANFGAGGGTALMIARLNQLFYTLTQPEGISQVSLHMEGEPIKVFSSEGLIIDNPWSRTEHAELPTW